MATILGYLHRFLDSALSWVRLLENREVGWLTIERKTGTFKCGQQPLFKKVKLLLLFNPLVEWIGRTHLFRLYTHEKNWNAEKEAVSPRSQKQIKGFIDFFHINMDHFNPSDPEKYTNFQSFFLRRLAPGARLLYAPNDPTKAIIAADCRAVVFPTVEKTREVWVKGYQFTIGNLIRDENRAKAWDNGAIACFQLSPHDYHRYHSPVSGKVKWYKQIPGDCFQVDPLALKGSVNILTENVRCAVCIETEDFGDMLFVAVGAWDVETVEFTDKTMTTGEDIKKGENLGLFKFGGSTIMVAFEQGRIKFDADLERWSHDQIMVDVEVGMSMGTATKSSKKQ